MSLHKNVLEAAIAESIRDPEFFASAAADAPFLAFMPGAEWAKSLENNSALLKQIVGARN
ncbi:hypothetical protein ACKVEX_16140 [Rhodocyclaceae bacterium SMB388]